MKRIRKIAILLIVAMTLLIGFTVTTNAATPKFSKKSVTVKKKKTAKLKLSSLSKKDTKKAWSFSTSDKAVASVKRTSKTSCKVNGKKDGYTVIRAKKGKTVAYALVKVGKGSSSVSGKTKAWASAGRIAIPGQSASTTGGGNNSDNADAITPTPTSTISYITASPSYVKIKIDETQQVVAEAWNTDFTKVTTGFSWSSANSAIAGVDQSGRITGYGEGSTTVYCSIGGKTEEISVEVERDFDETIAARSISYTSHVVSGGIIVIAKNNYKYGVNLTMTCLYRSSSGAMVGLEKDYNFWLEPGRECALFANDRLNKYIASASRYEISFTATDSGNMISNAAGISVTSNIGDNSVVVQAKNNGNTISYTDIAVVFLQNGSPVGFDSITTADCGRSGTTAYLQMDGPYDNNYEDIPFNGYKVYVNNSYGYTWMTY